MADTSSQPLQNIPASESAGIPARFSNLLTSAHPDGEKLVSARTITHPTHTVVVAELRDFSGFQNNFSLVAAHLIHFFTEEKGAQTTKIAASLAMKSISQAILNRLSITYLLSGRAPRSNELRFILHSKAPWVELYYDPRLVLEDIELDPAQGPAELFALSICFEEIIEVLNRELGKRKVRPLCSIPRLPFPSFRQCWCCGAMVQNHPLLAA